MSDVVGVPEVAEISEPGEARPVDDRVVPWRVFGAIGLLVAVVATIYWYTSYEDAGSVLLALASVLALWCGVYLWLQVRSPSGSRPAPRHGAETAEAVEPEPSGPLYLPHASVWPFAMGLGAALVLNGIVLGVWVAVPGAGLLMLGVAGFIRQTRRRD